MPQPTAAVRAAAAATLRAVLPTDLSLALCGAAGVKGGVKCGRGGGGLKGGIDAGRAWPERVCGWSCT
jgi:hypothetical protein